MSVLLDQQKNYNSDFGAIFRSSAIFYIPKNVNTTITVSNYWDFKNGMDVGLLFSIRGTDGSLIERRERYFEEGLVLNESDWPISEGSVEVEAFGNRNLRIPYAAVMGVYETESSVSMVHSYGRNHNLIEIEDGESLTVGRESCWTLKHEKDISNRAVFHNGHLGICEQEATFTLTNFEGEELDVKFTMPSLRPFETFVFSVEEILPRYKQFLNGVNGWGTLHFENRSAFTRLLLMWRNEVTNELQVTHSNFDYSEFDTNKIAATKPALMKWPSLLSNSDAGKVVIYPKLAKGTYKLSCARGVTAIDGGLFLGTKGLKSLEFSGTESNTIPSRIVTGFQYSADDDALPLECSMGIVHEKRPPKRFHWAVVSKRLKSQLFFNSFEEIYEVPEDIFIIFRMYSSRSKLYSELRFDLDCLAKLPDGLFVEDLFKKDPNFDEDQFSYISMFSNFGGLFMYSSMTKDASMTIEHSF